MTAKREWPSAFPRRKADHEVLADHSEPQANGCVIWTGATNKGYGKLTRAGRTWGAHRFAWTLAHGEIPEGKVIDHLCRTPLCINTDHMEVTTIQINTLRGISHSARNARKAFCKRGHEFTPENTFACNGDAPGRGCRACRRLWSRARRVGMKLDDYLKLYPAERLAAPKSVSERRPPRRRARRTHCHQGHPLDGGNLYLKPSTGERCCRECRRGYKAAARAARRQERAA